MRRLLATSGSFSFLYRGITTQAFLQSLEKVEESLHTATNTKAELIRYGRQLFETEVLDDLPSAYSWAMAGKICQLATQLRVSAVKGQPFRAVVEASMRNASIADMDVVALARVIHSCLVLRSPYLYELLFTFLRLLIAQAPSMYGVTVAILINAYGRADVHHRGLFQALCDSASTTLKDPRISLAHIANVAHALSRVHFFHQELMWVLREQSVRMANDAQPLVMVTILDAFAELGFVDEELFLLYETRLLERLKDMQPSLVASLLACLATASRVTPKLLEAMERHIMSQADAFDSASIAKIYHACFIANVLSEELFGALAERACKVPADFRADEVCQTLNALSSFDLFDGELFPLLASRLMTIVKQGDYVGVDDAAGILASFAAVQEHHDELIHVCTQMFAAHSGGAMSSTSMINALWACANLNVRNEAQIQLVEQAKKNIALLNLPPVPENKQNKRVWCILEKRREYALKAYAIES